MSEENDTTQDNNTTEPENKNSIQIPIAEYNQLKAMSGNIERLKKEVEERDRKLEQSIEEFETFKKTKIPEKEKLEEQVRTEFASKLSGLEEERNKISQRLKGLTVTDKVFSRIASEIVPEASPWIKQEIEKYCDIDGDYESGQIVVKDENGQPRWSKKVANEKMTADEFIEEVREKYPSFIRSGANPNETERMSGGQSSQSGSAKQNLSLSDVSKMSDVEMAKLSPNQLNSIFGDR